MKVELEEYFMCKTYKVSHKKQRHRVGRRQSWQSHVSVFNWVGEKAKGRERERVCVYVCVFVCGWDWTGLGIRIGKGSQSKDRISKPMRTVKAKTVTVQCFAGILPKIKRDPFWWPSPHPSSLSFYNCKFLFRFFWRPGIVVFPFLKSINW